MPKALLSVYDKTGLIDFAQALVDLGWELLASGGTARLLNSHSLPATEVSDYTGSPEILDGRVKTLHPAIHGGLLARNHQKDMLQLAEMGWQPIDLVAVNLYPFTETIQQMGTTLDQAIEQIDIGGVALIRAAAKNFNRVTVICEPGDYAAVLEALKNGNLDRAFRKRLAIKAFQTTTHYDHTISHYLAGENSTEIQLYQVKNLRYGENPHQQAALFAYQPALGPLGGKILQGKELSYNNLLDLDAAWRAVASYQKNTVVIVKHLSPCGIASSADQLDAYKAALASDPVSAFGGIVAANRVVESETADAVAELFVECIVAPGFSPEAREILAKKKNLRLLEMPDLEIYPKEEYRSIIRGMVRQTVDLGDPEKTQWKVVSKRQPTTEEMLSLEFAWKACQHVKSNAIVLVQGEATVGIGGGQPNRVDCVKIAAQRAGDRANGAVMASDAFFPFADSVEVAAAHGITAIIQPGGSIRDEESIQMAEHYNMAMIFTGIRHFRH